MITSRAARVRDRARKQLVSHYTFSAMIRALGTSVIMPKPLFFFFFFRVPGSQTIASCPRIYRRPASHSYAATRINWLHFREKSARAFIIAGADTARTFAHDNLRPMLLLSSLKNSPPSPRPPPRPSYTRRKRSKFRGVYRAPARL